MGSPFSSLTYPVITNQLIRRCFDSLNKSEETLTERHLNGLDLVKLDSREVHKGNLIQGH